MSDPTSIPSTAAAAEPPEPKLTYSERLKQIVHTIEPYLRKIFLLSWKIKTGSKWNPPRSKSALSYFLESYPEAVNTTHLKFLKYDVKQWDISVFGKLTYDTDIFDVDEIAAVILFRDVRNKYSHEEKIKKKYFESMFPKLEQFVETKFFEEAIKKRNKRISNPKVPEKLSSTASMPQVAKQNEDSDIPIEFRQAQYQITENGDLNVTIDFGFDAEVGVYISVSDKRLEYDEFTTPEVNNVVSKFARAGGEYFEARTGSIGQGRRVSFIAIAELLKSYGVDKQTIGRLIGQSILHGYMASSPSAVADYAEIDLKTDYFQALTEKLGAPYVKQLIDSPIQQGSSSPIKISYGFDEVTGVFLSVVDKRIAYSLHFSEEINTLIVSDLGKKLDEGCYFSTHTAAVGFGELVTSGETVVLLRRFGVPENEIALLRIKIPITGNMQFRMNTKLKRVDVCTLCETGEKRCSRCHTLHYCNDECFEKDWPMHKFMCKLLPFPPKVKSKRTVYGLVLDTNSKYPRLMQFDVSVHPAHDLEFPPFTYEKLDMSSVFGESGVEFTFVERDSLRRNRPCLNVAYREFFLKDGSPPNKCILSLTEGRAGHAWMGPVVALREDYNETYYDIQPRDISLLKHFFLSYGLQ